MAPDGGRRGDPLDKKRRAAAHPDRPGVRCSAPAGSYLPVIDHARCEGKRDCIDVCPNDVFEVRRIDAADFSDLGRLDRLKVRAHGMVTAYTPNADDCRACGLCVVACPEQAIVLTGPP
jgi:NAD-dependent dihydropyrimidine dehydrogenase PreA subunit